MARTGTHWGTVWSLRRDAATASATIVPATVMASLVLLLALPHDGLAQDTVAVHVFDGFGRRPWPVTGTTNADHWRTLNRRLPVMMNVNAR